MQAPTIPKLVKRVTCLRGSGSLPVHNEHDAASPQSLGICLE